MRVTIDGAGRAVVPKVLRDQLRLQGGTPLEIRARGGRLEGEPIATAMRLVRRARHRGHPRSRHLRPGRR